ncbi:MAG: DNA primase [Bacteroidales bacterium]|nr:DNA primase [Bacteroidales bacterium]
MKYNQDTIEIVKERADIVEVVGMFLTLTKKGTSHVGVCPFHTDKDPSLSVSPVKGIYKCFSCGATGDVIKFVTEHEKISFAESIKFLANKYQVELPAIEQTPEEVAREKQRAALMVSLETTQEQFAANLRNNSAASEYAYQTRMISEEIAELYKVGYATSDNQITRDFPAKGFNPQVLLAAGVIGVSDKGFQYDVFRDRLTLPFLDMYGKVIGFTGRYLGSEEKMAKYLNTGDTQAFSKGNVLFGLYQAKQHIAQQEKAYLVEGQIDVLSMAQKGIRNTVGGSGTAFTDAQAKLIKRYSSNTVIIYDGDKAGVKASVTSIKILLQYGLRVKGIILPAGDDPDSFAQKHDLESLPKVLLRLEKSVVDYLYEIRGAEKAEDFEKSEILTEICECISLVPDKIVRNEFIKRISILFKIGASDIKERIKPPKELKIQAWKHGFYGIDEALELKAEDEDAETYIVFDHENFINRFSQYPTVLVVGEPTHTDIQVLRAKISALNVSTDRQSLSPTVKEDHPAMHLLKTMHREGFDITIHSAEKSQPFCDYYVESYVILMNSEADQTGKMKATIIGRCAEVISDTSEQYRAVMVDLYAKSLGIKTTALNAILKPFLAKKKDKAIMSTQRLNEVSGMIPIDSETVPDYVMSDETLKQEYLRSGYYPIFDEQKRPMAYMFKNATSNSHACISDFYMKPLLHVFVRNNDLANKRVIELCHIHSKLDRFVEWPSSTFAKVDKVKEKLIGEGPFNFDGTKQQFEKIWRMMSYGFTYCSEIRVFGQQPEGFVAFANAIFHKGEAGDYTIDYMNDLGVATCNEQNYYSPAFSKIHIADRQESDGYKQVRHLIYKEVKPEDSISFNEWAELMNEVYRINDNGKWAILMSITFAFRDFIFKNRRYFTAPFFIGPTGSGKSKIAESIRNLFMDSNAPVFNLNTGTDAAFFMFLESMRNFPIVMEEYNDRSISMAKFQGLKSATLDGEGKIKVKDVASKSMDSSEINASIILLGQEAAQQDDGALSNRCIMCEVPYPSKDGFTEDEIAQYDRLKHFEREGLSNVLLEVLKLRPIVEKYFLSILNEESKLIKNNIKVNITNSEGLTRIVNAVALPTAMCKMIELHVPNWKLPFSYAEFFPIACDKVLRQIESISSTNKLSTYFFSIGTLITQEKIKIGREIKISEPDKVTIMLPGKETEDRILEVGTKILFIDFEAVYNLYLNAIGREEALSRQSLKAYFKSNQSFIGVSKSTRFTWQKTEYEANGAIQPNENGDASVNRTARLNVKTDTKTNSAYMFYYDQLKALLDIDFERLHEEEKFITPF